MKFRWSQGESRRLNHSQSGGHVALGQKPFVIMTNGFAPWGLVVFLLSNYS